ncbi:MAG: VWA domain-containing protein [Deltaproteobacteria bacterium]|nr:VWA domain-containing protein [Deltaproteobacteria bacterium]
MASWSAALSGQDRPLPASLSPAWAEASRRINAALAPWGDKPPAVRQRVLFTVLNGVERIHRGLGLLPDHPAQSAEGQALAALQRLPAEAAAAALLNAPILRSRLPRALQSPPAGEDAELRAAWVKAAIHTLVQQQDAEIVQRADASLLAAVDVLLSRLEEKSRALGVLGRALGLGLTTLGLGSDWSEGFVSPQAWDNLEALALEVERSPALRQLADALGRLDGARPAMGPAPQRWVTPPRDQRPARLAYGDRVATVTPGELALLADPDARLLFELRLAERALLCYSPPPSPPQARLALGPKAGDRRGPILLCLDSSGSMDGAPAQAARALTLCLARAALSHRRALRVTQFAAGQTTEWVELTEWPGSLPALIRLLTRGLSGGTDPRAALRGAVEALHDPRYAQADLLLVSDGRFLPEAETTAAITEAQAQRGLRAWALLLPPAGVSDEAAALAVPWAGRVIVARPETWPAAVWTMVRGATP